MQSSKPTKDSSAQRDSNHLATFFLSVAVFFCREIITFLSNLNNMLMMETVHMKGFGKFMSKWLVYGN